MERTSFKRLIELRDQITSSPWVVTTNKDGCRIDLGVDGYLQISNPKVAEFVALNHSFTHAITARFDPKNDVVPAPQKEKSP